MSLAIQKYRKWVGMSVRFRRLNKQGRRMIELGFPDGIIRNLTRGTDRAVLFEIEFGPAGSTRRTLFYRRAFIVHDSCGRRAPPQATTGSG